MGEGSQMFTSTHISTFLCGGGIFSGQTAALLENFDNQMPQHAYNYWIYISTSLYKKNSCNSLYVYIVGYDLGNA